MKTGRWHAHWRKWELNMGYEQGDWDVIICIDLAGGEIGYPSDHV